MKSMNKKQTMVVWGVVSALGLLFVIGVLSRRYGMGELLGMLLVLSLPVIIIAGLILYTLKKK